MKKTLLFMLALVLALPAMALNAGDTFMYDGLQYKVLDAEEKTCEVVAIVTPGENETYVHEYPNMLSGELNLPAYPQDDEGTYYILTEIDETAFWFCTKLTSVVIPETVVKIDNAAFEWCTGITSVTIGNSVTEIGNSAFSECISLTSVTIPNSVTTIDNNAFDGCSSLADLTIGSSVNSIGNLAFTGCSAIENIYYLPSTGVAANENIFDSSVYTNASLYVNYGNDKAVRSVSPWSKFTTSITTGVESLEVSDVNAAVEVYTLGGVKVADSVENLPAGLYIVRQGSKVTKVAVK
jgi:hypothetical protein